MKKISINLIIKKEKTLSKYPPFKTILPIVAIILLPLFIVSSLVSTYYINSNLDQYNQLNNDIDNIKKNISGYKENEIIYTLTSKRINVLEQIVKIKKEYKKIIAEIKNLEKENIDIVQVRINKDGKTSVSIVTPSAQSLDSFVKLLKSEENSLKFNNIYAQGIMKGKDGNYRFTIEMTIDELMLR